MPLFPQTPRQHPGYIAGRIYPTSGAASLQTATAPSAIDIIYFYPWVPPANITFTGGKMRVQTLGAGSSVKAGIWANSPVSMRPLGAPLFADNTGVTTQANTTDVTLAIGAGTLSAGVTYWFGSKYTGTLPVMLGFDAKTINAQFIVGLPSASAINSTFLGFADTYSNAMPTIAEAATFTFPGAVIPMMFLAT
jgi:hypothetical protein